MFPTPIKKGYKARYTIEHLRSIHAFHILDNEDGTYVWAEVVDVEEYGPDDRWVVSLRWPNGVRRKVLSTNLEWGTAHLGWDHQ